MLRRKPTRIELKPEDKEELEAARKESQQAQNLGTAQANTSGKQPLTPAPQGLASRSLFCGRPGLCKSLKWCLGHKSFGHGYGRSQCLAAAHKSSVNEVEIKLRLADREAHDKVASSLASSLQATHQQENFFFDGSNKELTSSRSILRCRFYNENQRALLTCKGRQELVGGIGRSTELETDIDPIKARSLLSHPDQLLDMHVDFVDELCRNLNVKQLVSLGGFRNVRKDFSWEGFKLELDETQFDWGTVFEIEVETEEPEQLKIKLEAFLQQEGVQYSYSTVTKFHNFMNRSLE